MAEFTYNPVQSVPLNQAAIMNNSTGCGKCNVLHEDGSGVVTLRGFARYNVIANGNIAVPTGGTAAPIAMALTVNGEVKPTSRAIVPVAAVEEYNHITCSARITVPCGCCFNVGLRNVAATDDPTVTPAPVIILQNLNMIVERIS